MEAEEVLLLIMKKLKEYKANPKQSTFHEKARQKNLRKMFSIYTSLKKRERAKQKEKEQSECTEEPILPQEPDQSFDVKVESEDLQSHCNENLDTHIKQDEIVSDSSDICEHDSKDQEENIMVNTQDTYEIGNENTEPTDEFVVRRKESDEYDEEIIEDTASLTTPSTSNDLIKDNQIMSDQNVDESDEYMEECEDEKSTAVDGFLMQLGEGLRKLPYRQRSKLEIEFLGRLYEVEDCLGLLDE